MTDSSCINKFDNVLLSNGVAMSRQSHRQSSQDSADPWPNRSHVEPKNYFNECLDPIDTKKKDWIEPN